MRPREARGSAKTKAFAVQRVPEARPIAIDFAGARKEERFPHNACQKRGKLQLISTEGVTSYSSMPGKTAWRQHTLGQYRTSRSKRVASYARSVPNSAGA
eukprot:3941078-Rhodomonas_salina.1